MEEGEEDNGPVHGKVANDPVHGKDICYRARERKSRSRAREVRILMVQCMRRKEDVAHGPKDAHCHVHIKERTITVQSMITVPCMMHGKDSCGPLPGKG